MVNVQGYYMQHYKLAQLWACIVYSTIDLGTNLSLSDALEFKPTTQGCIPEEVVCEGDDCEGL